MSLYHHQNLGEVTLNRSTKARRVSISIRPGGEVCLTIPHGFSEQEALKFLDLKQAWILQARERLQKRHPQQIISAPYSTRLHELQLEATPLPVLRASIEHGRIRVRYPVQMEHDHPQVQIIIQQAIEEAWRIEAKIDLPYRTQRLSLQVGLKCGKVSIRNSRTRWGSCSVANNISLSLQLMKLPDHLIDYVILHELCHVRHKNHGPRFHSLLEQLTQGRHKLWRKELKSYSTRW